ncbi:beta-lactamase family protein [Aquimarina sp. D1M17]|uniref:serine hydrolase domain-containing protein n=1 Tax=Aquimarina acroporae TaxID=2937283 RepID=UPI0020C0F2E8|nr:serine hydrolase domain-containing protein [Aquimarina acroporae]MCK8523642.1 beta-lactamase family protein [Aquimarina acroporae]
MKTSILKKAFKTIVKSTLSLFIYVLVFSSCEKDDPQQFCDPSPKFNIDLFVEELQTRLNDEDKPMVGYQLAINKDGNLYHSEAAGFAIHENDSEGPVAMTVNTRMNVASVSKFIGTIALLKAMEEHNVSLEFNVVNYLPESWRSQVHSTHSDVDSDAYLTFRKLLQMNTAINFPGDDPFPGIMPTETQMLNALVATPVMSRIGEYQNGNFTLIRVLIGEIVYNLDETAGDYSTACTDKYFEYVKENIYDPLNINAPSSPNEVESYYDGIYPWGYQWPFDPNFQNASDGTLGWKHSSNPYRNGGSGGKLLSSMDLAKILAFFKYDQGETIISKTQRESIINSELGLTESVDGTYGKYLCKGGLRGADSPVSRRALRSRIMIFPNGVEAVILTNSNNTSLGGILRNSFDNAWKSGCE